MSVTPVIDTRLKRSSRLLTVTAAGREERGSVMVVVHAKSRLSDRDYTCRIIRRRVSIVKNNGGGWTCVDVNQISKRRGFG